MVIWMSTHVCVLGEGKSLSVSGIFFWLCNRQSASPKSSHTRKKPPPHKVMTLWMLVLFTYQNMCIRHKILFLPLNLRSDFVTPKFSEGLTALHLSQHWQWKINFVGTYMNTAQDFRWLCWSIFSTLVFIICCQCLTLSRLSVFHSDDPGHSAKSAGGRLHLNMYTPLTQQSWNGLTMVLSWW